MSFNNSIRNSLSSFARNSPLKSFWIFSNSSVWDYISPVIPDKTSEDNPKGTGEISEKTPERTSREVLEGAPEKSHKEFLKESWKKTERFLWRSRGRNSQRNPKRDL